MTLIPYPPDSPDLVLCNFSVFPKLKTAIKEWIFNDLTIKQNHGMHLHSFNVYHHTLQILAWWLGLLNKLPKWLLWMGQRWLEGIIVRETNSGQELPDCIMYDRQRLFNYVVTVVVSLLHCQCHYKAQSRNLVLFNAAERRQYPTAMSPTLLELRLRCHCAEVLKYLNTTWVLAHATSFKHSKLPKHTTHC